MVMLGLLNHLRALLLFTLLMLLLLIITQRLLLMLGWMVGFPNLRAILVSFFICFEGG